MAAPIILKINCSKILKEHLFAGKNGKYLDIVIFENREPDQYGNTHTVYQGVSKAARESGVKGPIIGNAKFPEQGPAASAKQTKQPPQGEYEHGEEIPF